MHRHVQTNHTSDEEKKYKCDVCGKGFYQKGAFQDHMNTHWEQWFKLIKLYHTNATNDHYSYKAWLHSQ